MPGFATSISNNINCVFANNGDFSGSAEPNDTNGLQTNGQLWIGSTALNVGGTHINVGKIVSPGNTITIGYSSPNITIDVAGGMAAVEHLTGNTGGQLNPDGSNNFNILTANSTVKFAGTGATLTQDFGLTNILLGVPGSAITTADENVSLGLNSLGSITSGQRNTAIGKDSLDSVTTASDNTCVGWKAGNVVTGVENTLLGKFAGGRIAGGGQNVVIGKDALSSMTSGVSNIIIGRGAGDGYTNAESNNIVIGDSLNGTVGESNVTRIGNGQTKCFVEGIDGVNVGSVATVVTEASNQLGTAVITAGTGITVTPSANLITIASTSTVPFTRNLGITYSAGVFTITSANGSALSASNPAYISINSKVTPGKIITYTITADQSFNDNSSGSSTIAGNLFGLPTGIDFGSDIPFFIYAVSNTTDTDFAFMISRYPNTGSSPSSTKIGQSGSAIASTQGSFFALKSITAANFASCPAIPLGYFRMKKVGGAANDWQVQSLQIYEGLGNFTVGSNWTFLTGLYGASASSFFIPEGGDTAPVYTNTEAQYFISQQSNTVRVNYNLFTNSTPASGTGNVSLTMPYIIGINSNVATLKGFGNLNNAGTYTQIQAMNNTTDQTTNIYSTAILNYNTLAAQDFVIELQGFIEFI